MTQVNWSRQLALALALFVLGSLAYWLEFKQKPRKEEAEELSKKLFTLKDTQVRSIKLTSGGKTFELVCSDFSAKLCKPGDNSKWEMAQPMKVRADDSNANSLLSALNNLNSTETIDLRDETPEKRASLLKEYGLDAQTLQGGSARKVDVKTPAEESTLYLGATHPIGDGIFGIRARDGKIDETRVFLIPSYFKSNFDHDTTYWREKKLLTLGSHEVQSFKLNGSKGQISGERKEGQWILNAKGEEFTGDLETIDSLLTAAAFLSAKSFASDHKADAQAKAALKSARQVLSLTLQKEKGSADKTPEPIVLTLFQQKGKTEKLFAIVSNVDPLFELEFSAKDRLDKDIKDLRLTKLITSMERFTAKKLEFSGTPIGTPPLVLQNTDSKWTNAADKSEADSEKVQKLLDQLSGKKIKEFLQGAAIPTGEGGGLKFTLGDDKSDAKRQIVFWKAAQKLYARDLHSKRKEAFLIDTAVQGALPWDRNFFKKGEPPKTK